ncbi:DUF3095 family protein [Flavobacterium selenitireducens]|uniref:DUF3095 family protein n=1 Tax=Flavobacterium selenitireducens TaxID=2722704 RepID=UPI00168BDA1E|nr:DUF3095 family protein [Flavobacterium selenitireducens]MBD3581910.1 DUF3095 domain-containing protein [Flavobacterium selenitireducens]
MLSQSENFYSDLVAHRLPLGELLGNQDLFETVPSDWLVIITDIRNSTDAVLGGQHQTVNLLATGSIVSVLNIAFKRKITVPFFFGGDGATFLIPNQLRQDTLCALKVFQKNTLDNFGLDIRVGEMPVHKILSEGHALKIAKYHNSSVFSIPVILGDGLMYAEKIIKGKEYRDDHVFDESHDLDLSGMQCRWDRISPPTDKDEVVTLLVVSRNDFSQAQVFRTVIEQIEHLYGPISKRQPISVSQLRLNTTFGRLGTEMRVRIGKIRLLEMLRQKLISLWVFIYLRSFKGRRYLEKLVDMSDTLVLDGKINTVISGTVDQRKRLQEFLDSLESDARIHYGLHISNASIMSCYVRDLDDDHIHFVDGSDGGYTQAARMLKAKIHT